MCCRRSINIFLTILLLVPISASAESTKVRKPVIGNASVPLPRVYAPVRPRSTRTAFPWRKKIGATVFWVGEEPTERNPTPNHKSSWDPKWEQNFGGFDDPDPKNRSWDFRPKGFIPGQNPFYVALPYNDKATPVSHKESAKRMIPWFEKRYKGRTKSVCKGVWVAIRHGRKIAYAQWEDCGPFNTDDPNYVFGKARPKNTNNKGAGIDISPSVRDYLGCGNMAVVDWRFVNISEVTDGPWRRFGANNHFVMLRNKKQEARISQNDELRARREEWLRNQLPKKAGS